ncbi:coiled-coil domain-containing protein 120 isoform X1 [Solea solea]|uniref:coiled-coil domain-containing protein 120 isoform X1 n=1 Tax=Solea solea TaxID=90069 RepID=UPI00272D4914|nr:coiled-coil domain-containing protein 120 isoform X1 [Solea solea]XP_058499788.1 coiled-coil domain-containing protein 120 isoform X1 [Solea solea]
MATGVNYWSSNEASYRVSECVWAGEHSSSSSSEEGGGGGGVTWETPAMEVKGQLISALDPLTCSDRKQRERMAELQERRRGLQSLLSTRLAELRRICLQEAELTGAVPHHFPLEAGEKLPCVRRRGGASHQVNRKYRAEDEDSQRSKLKKTLFSGALRKHSDSEHNTHTQTHTNHGKRTTVHRGCHTDDTVRSESSSTSDSTGHDNEDSVSQCRPLLVSAGSPVDAYYQSKTKRNLLHNRADHSETLQTHKPLPLLPAHPLPLPPPPLSQDSSSGPSDPGAPGEGGIRVNAARRSSSSDGLLDHITGLKEDGSMTGVFRSSEVLMDGRTKLNNKFSEGQGRGGGAGRGRGGGYSEILLDYVWGKQQQLQRQQSQPNPRQPITSQHQLLYNGYSSQTTGAPPTFHNHHGEQRHVKVTRTKSCGPFLPVQQKQFENNSPPRSAIQPDPHPHLLPPRPPQQSPNQDPQLEEATRSLHKALALEGLRDWYLRNTASSIQQNHTNGKVSTGVMSGFEGQSGGGGARQRRRTTHGVIQQSTFQNETSHHPTLSRHKQKLPHSATFHGHPLHGRSVDNSLYHDCFPPQKEEVPLREPCGIQPSPGTLV